MTKKHQCPHCGEEITKELAASVMGSAGGKRSRRTITPEQQAKMQEKRKKNDTDEALTD